jgi:hypothetical protein
MGRDADIIALNAGIVLVQRKFLFLRSDLGLDRPSLKKK